MRRCSIVGGATINYYTIMLYKLTTKRINEEVAESWANNQKHAVERMKTFAMDLNVYEITARPMEASKAGNLIPAEDCKWLLLQRLPWQGENYTITTID